MYSASAKRSEVLSSAFSFLIDFIEAIDQPLHALLGFNYKSKTFTPPNCQRTIIIIIYYSGLSLTNSKSFTSESSELGYWRFALGENGFSSSSFAEEESSLFKRVSKSFTVIP